MFFLMKFLFFNKIPQFSIQQIFCRQPKFFFNLCQFSAFHARVVKTFGTPGQLYYFIFLPKNKIPQIFCRKPKFFQNLLLILGFSCMSFTNFSGQLSTYFLLRVKKRLSQPFSRENNCPFQSYLTQMSGNLVAGQQQAFTCSKSRRGPSSLCYTSDFSRLKNKNKTKTGQQSFE